MAGSKSDISVDATADVDKNDDRFDDDLQVLYSHVVMKDAHCKHMHCKGSCQRRMSQPGKDSPIKELKNPASEFIKETDDQNSPDLKILFTDSEGSTVTENKVTQGERQKQFLVSGLTGKDLYLCGKPHCEYQAATESQLSKHMHECDLSHKGVIQCRHCSAYFKSCRTLINHLSLHGGRRYSCALCPYCDTAPTDVEQHLKHHHKVSCTEIVPVDPSLETDMFIVQPKFQVKVLPKHDPTEHVAKIIYRPEEIHTLPMSGILKEPIHCSECSFKTKVCSDMKEHLGLHLDQDVDPADIHTIEDFNPVVHHEHHEKIFHKMPNLAASSYVGVPELSSSVTSNSFSPALSAALPLPPASPTPPPQAVPLTEPMLWERKRRMNATYHSGTKQVDALRIKAFSHDLSEPLLSSSPVKVEHDAASTSKSLTKQATNLQARMSVHELPEPMNTAAAIPSQPSKRAATLRDRASIRGLSETVLTSSRIASAEGSDTEEPSLKKKPAFTSPQQKDPTAKEEKICKDCGKECKNLHGLKMHIIRKHQSSVKWSCGYCHHVEASRKCMTQHSCMKHPGKPELVEFYEGATSLNRKALEEADRQAELPGLLTAEMAHHCKQKHSQSTMLKHDDEFIILHHSMHHPDIEQKHYIERVSDEAKRTKFECKKCCFTSDNFGILKEHLQIHISEFKFFLSAQQDYLEKRVRN